MSRISELDPFALWQQLGLPSWVVLSRPDLGVVEIRRSIGEGVSCEGE